MKKVITILALVLTTSLAFAQDGETAVSPSTTFAGSADAYYKYAFSGISGGYTSFTNSNNSFELGMASIEASHKWKKASVFVDLGFGSRAKEFTYNDNAYTFMIKQLTFTYDVSDSFKIVAGTFGTHIGYELLDAVDNKNYSMSYAFTYGPFFNTGVKAQYTSGKFSFMAGVTNPTDFKSAIETQTNSKTYIGQVAYVGETGSAYLNISSGLENGSPLRDSFGKIIASSDENRTQFDFVGTKKFGDKFAVGFNATYADTNNNIDSSLDGKWYSLVLYPSYTISSSVLLAYRLEYMDSKDATASLGTIAGSSIIGNTLSLNYKVGNMTIIPEIRIDSASNDIFVTNDDSFKGVNTYALVAATYTF
ncbi:outer membrane beta-barrel protein [Flavobacterium sp. IMCC34518]|uniref:outer membrane beta-barrel protein n=1 Tax=Flavobacterium sp. IMCC34518 TaxID=3003623 RepID=UPI0022AC6AA9|nr:outer membrane beta-barrel protein [Flavobacterium sp. IMCC34518]